MKRDYLILAYNILIIHRIHMMMFVGVEGYERVTAELFINRLTVLGGVSKEFSSVCQSSRCSQ